MLPWGLAKHGHQYQLLLVALFTPTTQEDEAADGEQQQQPQKQQQDGSAAAAAPAKGVSKAKSAEAAMAQRLSKQLNMWVC